MFPEPWRDHLEICIDAWFRHCDLSGIVSLRSFDQNDKGKPPFRITPTSLKGGLKFLMEAAEDDARRAAYNPKPIVFCPPIATFTNTQQAGEKDLFEGPVLSVDLDKNPRAALAKLEALLGPATLVVRSGGAWVNPETGEDEDKLHAHWRLKEPARGEDLKKLKELRRLATILVDGDRNNIPISHPLRWPGSWHRKGTPRLCEIVSTEHIDNEIDLDLALAILQENTPKAVVLPFKSDNEAQDFTVAEGFKDLPVGDPGEVDSSPHAQPKLLAAALAVIPNSKRLYVLCGQEIDGSEDDPLDWDGWNYIGMATWRGTKGMKEGFFLAFLPWSRKWPKYIEGTEEEKKHFDRNTMNKWNAFFKSPPTQLGAGTIFFLADKASPGWREKYEDDGQDGDDGGGEGGGNGGEGGGGTTSSVPGFNLNPNPNPPLPNDATPRPPLKGGVYSKVKALDLLNAHFFIGKRGDEASTIQQINDDGSLTPLSVEQFNLLVANIFVITGKAVIPASSFWKAHPWRHQRKIVFKPGGTTKPEEFNIWLGFGVVPREEQSNCSSLLDHILKVICRNNKVNFRYLMRWLAWKVRNPDRHPETVIVLISKKQGAGKSLLSDVMSKIFGKHALLVDDPEQIFGTFNAELERACFIQAEEILWAGDRKLADRIKSFITGRVISIHPKFLPRFQIPNRLATILTTNHEHAVALGSADRRFFVLEVDEQYVGDEAYFDRLWNDIENGGVEEFLYCLLNLKLPKDWHPRKMVKTEEAIEQQQMSADSISQWMQRCIDAEIIRRSPGPHGSERSHLLGTRIATEYLYEAYAADCKQQGGRTVPYQIFGRVCTRVFGPRQRCNEIFNDVGDAGVDVDEYGRPNAPGQRPWGYDVPTADVWQERLDAQLGIPKE